MRLNNLEGPDYDRRLVIRISLTLAAYLPLVLLLYLRAVDSGNDSLVVAVTMIALLLLVGILIVPLYIFRNRIPEDSILIGRLKADWDRIDKGEWRDFSYFKWAFVLVNAMFGIFVWTDIQRGSDRLVYGTLMILTTINGGIFILYLSYRKWVFKIMKNYDIESLIEGLERLFDDEGIQYQKEKGPCVPMMRLVKRYSLFGSKVMVCVNSGQNAPLIFISKSSEENEKELKRIKGLIDKEFPVGAVKGQKS